MSKQNQCNFTVHFCTDQFRICTDNSLKAIYNYAFGDLKEGVMI